jgi:hypothetical protein
MATDICIRLGERIRTLRKKKGWRQIDLSQHSGVHEVHISDLECVFRSMWAGDSIRCGHLILFDVGSYSVVMWAAFAVLP